MTHVRCKVYLAVLLLSIARPQLLLGLNDAPPAPQFFCNGPKRDAGPDWLVWHEPSEELMAMPSLVLEERDFFEPNSSVRLGGLMQSKPGYPTSAGGQSTCKSAAVYGLELAGAAVASSAGMAGAFLAAGAVNKAGDVYYVPAVAVLYGGSVLSSIFLSALGTHIIGGLLGRRQSFSHALVGGVVGGIAGDAVLLEFLSTGGHGEPSWPLLPIGLALPAAGAVVSYNIWRNI